MSSGLVDGVGLAACAGALGATYLRWLRVAQREHYLPGATVLFARRWWLAGMANRVVFTVVAAAAAVSIWYAPAAFVTALAIVTSPVGLSVRGRTSKLAWTSRLRRLAGISSTLTVVTVGVAALFGLHAAFSAAALCAVGAPALVDAALWLARPVEGHYLAPYVGRARRRLSSVSPRIVAITGSYGKTTTKGYVAHLAAGSLSVVASPASFNNTPGLARAVNEHLATGTQVFVAEMGTYGPGEIKAMCEWATPEVAVITAIGPVHLERMGSLESIAEAKAEILEKAKVAVLNIDHPLLEQLARKVEEEGKTVWRCSSKEPQADVRVTAQDGVLSIKAEHFGMVMDLSVAASPEVEPGNVACAIAAALSLGVPPQTVAARLATLPSAPHRRSLQVGATGARVIDDTYNANPAGAQAALALLASLGAEGARKVVVTPGMVELGALQDRENANFAARAGAVATDMVIVGRTNARALLGGARAAGIPARLVRNRPAAVAWVSDHLRTGDVVLYENDLPDHYP
jgi:UDP-N-acetylmuramoyl-tripeptide--D-alanyl-D-alanine ligase